MSKKGVEQKHSETAIFAALYRAVAHKEFINNERLGPDYLAENFLPPHFKFFVKFKKIRLNVQKKAHKLTPGIYEYMIARTVFFDQAFKDALNNKFSQIVILGAGYDTRAYRYAALNKETKIFELDVATTQKRKKTCLKKAQIDIPHNVTLVPINFNTEALQDVLENAGYDHHEKTLFIWEGTIYYLEPDAVDATLEFVLNSSRHDSIILFDYAISISEEHMNTHYGVKEFVQTWRKQRSNEPFKFSIDDGSIESFLKQRGLNLLEHLDNKEIENTFLLHDNGSIFGQINGAFRFAMASSDNALKKKKGT